MTLEPPCVMCGRIELEERQNPNKKESLCNRCLELIYNNQNMLRGNLI